MKLEASIRSRIASKPAQSWAENPPNYFVADPDQDALH
jgi:hypothetical protein